MLAALKQRPGAILFIDEIHTIVGAGATQGGSLDASNILKPALASGELRCIGATTYQDYKQHFERDRALARRFQKIEVGEPSVEETHAILRGLQEPLRGAPRRHLHATARCAPRPSSPPKHVNDRFLPDKAIDVIDEAGAARAVAARASRQKKTVRTRDIEQVVATMAKIPPRRSRSRTATASQTLDRD